MTFDFTFIHKVEGTTPLHIACKLGFVEIVVLLLQMPKIALAPKDIFFKILTNEISIMLFNKQMTPLQYVKRVDIFTLLLTKISESVSS